MKAWWVALVAALVGLALGCRGNSDCDLSRGEAARAWAAAGTVLEGGARAARDLAFRHENEAARICNAGRCLSAEVAEARAAGMRATADALAVEGWIAETELAGAALREGRIDYAHQALGPVLDNPLAGPLLAEGGGAADLRAVTLAAFVACGSGGP